MKDFALLKWPRPMDRSGDRNLAWIANVRRSRSERVCFAIEWALTKGTSRSTSHIHKFVCPCRRRTREEATKYVPCVTSNTTTTTTQQNIKMTTMRKTLALVLLLVACLASVSWAQDSMTMTEVDAVPAEMSANATDAIANATSAEEAGAAAGGAPQFPVFNYETIYPNGIFNPEAYSQWMQEVTQFYTNIYEMYAGEGVQALEQFYGAGQVFNPFTAYTQYLGAVSQPFTYTGGFGGWYPGQGVEAVVSSLSG